MIKLFERVVLAVLFMGAGLPAVMADLVLVENGQSYAPIVVFDGAPPMTRRAADELAGYMEKISGIRPEVIEGCPEPLPQHAIWVGYQPALNKIFPEIDFNFQHPEEILIAANDKHLVIAGRDRWDPERLVVDGRFHKIDGLQQEYGTINAVYTFIQDYLDVRWLWPGAMGEDIIKQDTLACAPFAMRHHPQIRSRGGMFPYSQLGRASGANSDWVRRQRVQLDSLQIPAQGHAFGDWWAKYHKDHPEYFALQPDGTRGGGDQPFPGERTVKMCKSNPGLWEQWLQEVAQQLENNPLQTVFDAAANDGGRSGYCGCENCR
ncbi:MAG: DUF4838 domain-containing protein, partial [Lentisphaerae bacterium]|nr:DUF4838 domain-containing protein [Lentisphaerota bacterium]